MDQYESAREDAKNKANYRLERIFKIKDWKTTNEFLEEKELIENLLYHFYVRNDSHDISSSDYRNIVEESIKEALACKNTQNIVNSNLKMIESNKELANSNEKYQLALNLLTWALVLVGLIQVGLQIRKN